MKLLKSHNLPGKENMKKIIVEGCGSCLFCIEYKKNHKDREAFCSKTLSDLDITWSVNPWYVHPDCPLAEEEEPDKQASNRPETAQG